MGKRWNLSGYPQYPNAVLYHRVILQECSRNGASYLDSFLFSVYLYPPFRLARTGISPLRGGLVNKRNTSQVLYCTVSKYPSW